MKENLKCGCRLGFFCETAQELIKAWDEAQQEDARTDYDDPRKPETSHLYLKARGQFVDHLEKGAN